MVTATCWPATRSHPPNGSSWTLGSGRTRRRASGQASRQGWTTADKTGNGDYASTNDIGIAYGPDRQRLLLAVMTRTATDDPKAPNNRLLIGELTTLLIPELLP